MQACVFIGRGAHHHQGTCRHVMFSRRTRAPLFGTVRGGWCMLLCVVVVVVVVVVARV